MSRLELKLKPRFLSRKHAAFPCQSPSSNSQSPSGFTLVEVLVVTAISLLLLMAGTFIYINALKVYRECQEMTEVYQVARQFDNEMHDLLGHVVPLRGVEVTPYWLYSYNSPGPGASGHVGWLGGLTFTPNWGITSNYYERDYYEHKPYTSDQWGNIFWYSYDAYFSGPQDLPADLTYTPLAAYRAGPPSNWQSMGDPVNYYYIYGYLRDWWMPGFYGYRNANATIDYSLAPPPDGFLKVVERYDYYVGAWGWPRPDYRLNADADLIASKSATITNGGNVACWFYAEDRYFDSQKTMALDNSNIVLASLKFTRRVVNGVEQTQLSVLSHHMVGMDHPQMGGSGYVRKDLALNNMLRSVSITPYYMDAGGNLQPMDDTILGCALADNSTVTGAGAGLELPRCFDVKYKLHCSVSGKTLTFALRVYNRNNVQ